MKSNIIYKYAFLFFIVILTSCNKNSKEDIINKSSNTKETEQNIDLSYLYDVKFMNDNKIDEIEVSLDKMNNQVFTVLFEKSNKKLLKSAVAPGKEVTCYSSDCVAEELQDCFDRGGSEATLEKGAISVTVSCK